MSNIDNGFYLTVDNIHQVFVGVYGNPAGIPVVVLHGGPGSGGSAKFTDFFDLDKFLVIIPDQRGAGKSTPQAELGQNTTPLLIADIEAIRRELRIDKWHVFGGSWGSTLALAYAVNHQHCIKSLLLRGLFLASAQEINFFFEGEGGRLLAPSLWQLFSKAVPPGINHVDYYYDEIVANPSSRRKQLIANWHNWSVLSDDCDLVTAKTLTPAHITRAMIMLHYLKHHCFFESDLLSQCRGLTIPMVLVHGKDDMICPMTTAIEFAEQVASCRLLLVDDAGHDPFQASMMSQQRAIIQQW